MTAKLDLEFTRARYGVLVEWSWTGMVFFIIGGVIIYVLLQALNELEWQKTNIDIELAHENRVIEQINSQFSNHLKISQNSISLEQIKETQLVVNTLSMPWSDLLNGIEKASLEDVALLSLQPDSKKQQVVLTGEAKNLPAVLAYIDRLESQTMLEKVYLQKHGVSETDNDRPVQFTIVAIWQTGLLAGTPK